MNTRLRIDPRPPMFDVMVPFAGSGFVLHVFVTAPDEDMARRCARRQLRRRVFESGYDGQVEGRARPVPLAQWPVKCVVDGYELLEYVGFVAAEFYEQTTPRRRGCEAAVAPPRGP